MLRGTFCTTVLVILIVGLAKTLFSPKDVNYYENRSANKIEPLSVSAYLDGSFQEKFDDALMDQVNFAQSIKKKYNDFHSQFLLKNLQLFLGYDFNSSNNPERYINFMGMRLFNNSITYSTRKLSSMTEALNQKATNYNQYINNYNKLDFYIYFIEKDTDINFETNEKVRAYEYLRERIHLADNHIASFSVNSYEEFTQNFYRTDHHWKYTGSYLGYSQIMNMFGYDDLMVPVDEVCIDKRFSGSKALLSGADSFYEDFIAYRFEYPEMDIWISGQKVADYGYQNEFFQGDAPYTIRYGSFYGGDDAEIIFDNHRPERENILVIGESYDNAILKLIASHFNRTYSIDLRHYSTTMGHDFAFSDYVAKNNITKILLIGNIDYFIMDEFLLEG